MLSSAQIVPLTTSNAPASLGGNAPVFTGGQTAIRTATRANASHGLSVESAKRNKQQTLVVAVEARHSAFRAARSAKSNLASFEALHSATAHFRATK